MATRRRWLVGVLLAFALGGFAAGLVLSNGAAGAPGRVGVLARGQFHNVGWGTAGGVSVVRERSGALVLHFDRHFHTHGAPDLWVYVGKSSHWQLAGRLSNFAGRQTYRLPSVPQAGSSVMIFCTKCNRAFGVALLHLAPS